MATLEIAFSPYVAFGSRTLLARSPNQQGSDVALLQLLYNLVLRVIQPAHGPIGRPVAVDGIFGPKTRLAVIDLQTYFGLTADGIAGPHTYAALGQGGGKDTALGSRLYGSRELSEGASGSDVKALQRRLSTFSYARFLGRPADGVFDAATTAALLAFRRDVAALGQAGPPSGVADAATYDATWLYAPAGGRSLFVGRSGLDVAFVQCVLRDLGDYRSPMDGYFGATTDAAVRALQDRHALDADGVVGPQTLYAVGLENDRPAPRPFPAVRF